jgi:4-hydroxy-tetrahydrodipicolinate reductase
MAQSFSVWLCGPFGKMGSTLREAIAETTDISITGVVSPEHVGESCECGDQTLTTFDSLESLAASTTPPDVIVDFTFADACFANAMYAARNGIDFVTGTTGMTAEQTSQIEKENATRGSNAIIASNFSVGAVLMMHYAAQAAQHFERAEIVEIHHTRKKDAPSGTAKTTQNMMVEASEFTHDDIPIHSIRLPGVVAHQNVYLSAPGEVLRIEHDANDRTCFMSGILLAIRHVEQGSGVIYSIESLLFPDDN